MTSQAQDQKLGKLAYEAYVMQLGTLSTDTPWDGLLGSVQDAWIACARTIEMTVLNERDYAAA
jgi:hypothetical protein